jgi:hypothetical protein
MSQEQPSMEADVAPGPQSGPAIAQEEPPQPAPMPGEEVSGPLPVDPADAETQQETAQPAVHRGAATLPAAPSERRDPPAPVADAGAGSELEELVLPSLVSAPEPLAPGTEIGPGRRLRVIEHLGTRGRVNLYAATWRPADGQ